MTPSIRILLVDDNALMRMGLVASLSLEQDMKIVGEAGTGKAGIEKYAECTPDVVLMDLRLPDIGGDEAIAELCRRDAGAKIIAFSSYETHEDIYRCVHAGARSYLPKATPLEELLRTIRLVHAGQNYLPPVVTARLMERMQSPELSAREKAVLDWMIEGRTNKEIAQRLSIAETTVKDHVSSILSKLKASDRTEAATIAIRRGIVRVD